MNPQLRAVLRSPNEFGLNCQTSVSVVAGAPLHFFPLVSSIIRPAESKPAAAQHVDAMIVNSMRSVCDLAHTLMCAAARIAPHLHCTFASRLAKCQCVFRAAN